ncbi:MAG TPA: TonB-dependent receptor, partial [Terriglobales bacterium]|nr:TonB-dependent receptor [Terriglobales bacterium]
YLQDAWTIRQRLTLNLGLRYDRFISYYPAQSTSPNLTFPDLFPPTKYPASGNLIDWNNVSPRIGIAWDPSGKGNSVLRFSYGRFYKMEGTGLVETVNPVGFAGKGFTWTDSNHDGIPQVNEWKNPANLIFAFGGTSTHIDPHMSRPYTNEFSVSYEHQLWSDLRVSASYFYRSKKNLIGLTNTAVSPSDYTPVTGFTNPITNQPLTLFNLAPAKVGQFNILMTNIAEMNDNAYHGVEFDAVKRLSHRWQLLAGFTVQRQKGVSFAGSTASTISSDDAIFGENFADPNLDINRRNNYLNLDSTYVFKVDSTYEMPWKIGTSVNFQHYTGYPIQPVNVFNGLNQGPETVILEPAGNIRLPSVNLLNLRLSRDFAFADRWHVEPLVDLFNITNSQTIISKVNTFGPSFLFPSNTVNPFIARFGLKVNF